MLFCGAMLGANLKSHFDRLDFIEKTAVQEAVFAPGGKLNPTKFEAKYQQAAPLGKSLGWRADGSLVDLFIVYLACAFGSQEKLESICRETQKGSC